MGWLSSHSKTRSTGTCSQFKAKVIDVCKTEGRKAKLAWKAAKEMGLEVAEADEEEASKDEDKKRTDEKDGHHGGDKEERKISEAGAGHEAVLEDSQRQRQRQQRWTHRRQQK